MNYFTVIKVLDAREFVKLLQNNLFESISKLSITDIFLFKQDPRSPDIT